MKSFSSFEIDDLRRHWSLAVEGRFSLSGDRRFLATATEYLWSADPLAEFGKGRYAKIRIVPSPICALFERPPFPLLVVWRAGWLAMGQSARAALSDWLACQVEIAKGGARLARPDIVEYSCHLADYGAWLECDKATARGLEAAPIQPTLFDEAVSDIDFSAKLPSPKTLLSATADG